MPCGDSLFHPVESPRAWAVRRSGCETQQKRNQGYNICEKRKQSNKNMLQVSNDINQKKPYFFGKILNPGTNA